MADITETSTDINELVPSNQARYAAVFENSPNCIHELDRNGRICAMNDAGRRLVGTDDVEAVIGSSFLSLVSDADRDRVAELVDKAFRNKIVNYEFVGTVGQSFSSMFIPVTDNDGAVTQLVGLTQDLSDERLNADELLDLQGRNALILESAGEGIYGLDADGRLTFGNEAAARIVGWRTEDVIGQKSHDVHHHSHPDGSN